MKFDLTIGGRPARSYDADGNRQETTFDRMSEFLYQFTGYDVDDHVDMIGKPTINNFKFLVDVFPFKQNRHWHFTAGFYWGPSQFAYAENAVESAVSLVSVGIYNRMYEKAVADEPLFDLESMGFDGMDYQPEYMDKIYKKIIGFGRLGFAVGEFNGAFGVDKYGKYHQISADHYSYDEAGKPYGGICQVKRGIQLWRLTGSRRNFASNQKTRSHERRNHLCCGLPGRLLRLRRGAELLKLHRYHRRRVVH